MASYTALVLSGWTLLCIAQAIFQPEDDQWVVSLAVAAAFLPAAAWAAMMAGWW